MSKVVTGTELFQSLNKYLNLPDDQVSRLEIVCIPGEPASVKVWLSVKGRFNHITEESFSEYQLVDKNDTLNQHKGAK